ncbi:MAG: substrate-binding periplasmic protein [Pseudomonadota bacterium]
MRNTVFRWLLALGLLIASSLAAAETAKEPDSPLLYAVYDQPPWVIEGEDGNGRKRGIMPAYVREIMRRAPEVNIEIKLVPFRRGLMELREGNLDMAPTLDDPKVREFATPIAPFGHVQLALFTREPVDLEANPPKGDFRVGHLRGLPVPEKLKSLPGLRIVPFNRGGGAIESLDKGHLDGVILAEVVYRYYTEYFDWPYSHFYQARFLGNLPLYLWVREEDADRQEYREIARAMASMAEDGTAEAMMKGIGVDFRRQDQRSRSRR